MPLSSTGHSRKQTLCGATSQSILSVIVIIEANARAYRVPATALSTTETVTHNPSHSSMRLALLHACVTTEEMPAWFFSSRAGTWSHVGTALTAKPTRGRLDNRKIPVSGGVQGKGPRLHRSMLSPPKRIVHSEEPATCLGFPPN